tara:strand:- start:139 stop:324 length:186 start_codon:yes stop_codon:yes gene_type:complete
MEVRSNQPITYRMKFGGFAWHFNPACDLYPKEYYEEKTFSEPEKFMMVCIKCKNLTNDNPK